MGKSRKILDVGCGYGRVLNELPEGAVVRHHTKEYLRDFLSDFEEIVFKEVVYTTMNGNKSNGCYFMGKLKNERD